MIDIERFLISLRFHKNADGKLDPIYLADTLQKEIEIIQEAVKHSQWWVGLTDEEQEELMDNYDVASPDYAKAIEAKLKEKNT